MADGGRLEAPSTTTVTEEISGQRSPGVRLKLQKPKTDKKLKWAEGTVDNEHMNKKKSKCCCIYEKPKLFGESSSEDDDDDCTDHCRGHKKKCYQHDSDHSHPHNSQDGAGSSGASS